MTFPGDDSGLNRRTFLRHGATLAGLSMAAPWEALTARLVAGGRQEGPGYGALAPVADKTTGLPLLMLPEGFTYLSFGWTGDKQADGSLTPGWHDGMAAFPSYRGFCRLVRNHEIGAGEAAFAPSLAYDLNAGGGTTTLDFDTRRGQLVRSFSSLSGTVRNCAGGPTPWGSWLTCEEALDDVFPGGATKPHGYIFEVPAFGTPTRLPLTAMGRFVHEALAVDPVTGFVYETEDRTPSGFYRFRPHVRGDLAKGGSLQMLGIAGQPRFDTMRNMTPNVKLPVVWYDIADPSRPHYDPNAGDGAGVFAQGFEQGGAQFARLEGAWQGNGVIYFVSTSGGNARQGQIFVYDPAANEFWLLFESPSSTVLAAPDNICVSPRGGLVLCEDGGGLEYLHGLTPQGDIFRFCQNNVVLNGERNGIVGNFTGSEFAGATFSPDGRWLFCNIQSPGISLAITGPWEDGAL